MTCSRPAISPNGDDRPSLPGLRMPLGSSAIFTDCSTPCDGPIASAMNRARLRPTPWWCDRFPPAVQHRSLAGIPHRDVRRLDLVGRWSRGEREVQARPVEVAVREVAAGGARSRHGEERGTGLGERRGQCATTARRSPSCRRRSPCGSAPAVRWCRCGGSATSRPAPRRPVTAAAALVLDDAIVASTRPMSPSSSTSSVHCVPSPPWPRCGLDGVVQAEARPVWRRLAGSTRHASIPARSRRTCTRRDAS